jgi:predicted amidohydrolase YtcJ
VTSDAQLVIRGVTVVDPRDGSLRAGQDVRVAGDRIVSVEPAGDGQPVPAAAQVVDAAGRYLVPGFTDMHAHPLGAGDPSGSFDLMLAHGVTGFRQMSGSARMLKDRAAGTLMPAGAAASPACGTWHRRCSGTGRRRRRNSPASRPAPGRPSGPSTASC